MEKDRVYILAVGARGTSDARRSAGLGVGPWNFVFDFDTNGAETGFASTVQPVIREHRALHELTLGDRALIQIERSCYWYYARGLSRRLDSLAESSWMAWKRKYGFDIQEQFRRIAAGRKSQPVTVLSLWSDERHIETIFSAAVDVFDASVDFVVASAGAAGMGRLRDLYGATLIDIAVEHLAEGIVNQLAPGLAGAITRRSPLFPRRRPAPPAWPPAKEW